MTAANPSPSAGDVPEASSLPPVKPWPWAGRIGFRFSCCYLVLSILSVTYILGLIPWVGPWLAQGIGSMWAGPVAWVAQHVVHLTGIAAHEHATDSRDRALDWIQLALIVGLSAVVTVVWSVLDRRRREYRAGAAGLRFFVRLAVIFLMLRYGLMKVFPLQMPPPPLPVLNEPVGNTSPLMLLWTVLGLHPGYEMLCGAIETLCAVLLVFRRTALAGALLTAFVMTNVLLFNLFFDVPVKLGAANLLLYALALIAPDLPALLRFFWSGRPAAPTGVWAPLTGRRNTRLAVVAVEVLFLALALFQVYPYDSQDAAAQRASLLHPSPLTGVWQVDSVARTVNGSTKELPVLTGNEQPMTALSLEPAGNAFARAADGRLWRCFVQVNAAQHTMTLMDGYFDGERFNATYRIAQPDTAHLVLTPLGADAATHGTLTLTRTQLPASYPLLDRTFHWVNEWGYWR